MTKTTTSTTFQDIDFDSADFEGEIATSSSIPYAQVENPRSGAMADAQVRKLGVPFGIFINESEAEKAGFKLEAKLKNQYRDLKSNEICDRLVYAYFNS